MSIAPEQQAQGAKKKIEWLPKKKDMAYYMISQRTPRTVGLCATDKVPGGVGTNPAWDDVDAASGEDLLIAQYACTRCPLLETCREQAMNEAFAQHTGIMGGVVPSVEQRRRRRQEKRNSKANVAA